MVSSNDAVGTVEVVCHLHDFTNLDLLKKGLYRIDLSVLLPPKSKSLVANSSSVSKTNSQDVLRNPSSRARPPNNSTSNTPMHKSASSVEAVFNQFLSVDSSGTIPNDASAILGIPYTSASCPVRHQSIAPGSGLIANSDVVFTNGRIVNENSSYRSRIVYIRFNDELFSLEEAVTFRLEAPLWRLLQEQIVVKLDLYHANAESEELHSPEDEISTPADKALETFRGDGLTMAVVRTSLFERVSSRSIQLKIFQGSSGSIHYSIPIVFEKSYLCCVHTTLHAAFVSCKLPSTAASVWITPSLQNPKRELVNRLHKFIFEPLICTLRSLRLALKLAHAVRYDDDSSLASDSIDLHHNIVKSARKFLAYVIEDSLSKRQNMSPPYKHNTELVQYFQTDGRQLISCATVKTPTCTHNDIDGYGCHNHKQSVPFFCRFGTCNGPIDGKALCRAMAIEAHAIASAIFMVWHELQALLPETGHLLMPITSLTWWKQHIAHTSLCGTKRTINIGELAPSIPPLADKRNAQETPIHTIASQLQRLLQICAPGESSSSLQQNLCDFEEGEGFDAPFGGPLQIEQSSIATLTAQVVVKLVAFAQHRGNQYKALTNQALSMFAREVAPAIETIKSTDHQLFNPNDISSSMAISYAVPYLQTYLAKSTTKTNLDMSLLSQLSKISAPVRVGETSSRVSLQYLMSTGATQPLPLGKTIPVNTKWLCESYAYSNTKRLAEKKRVKRPYACLSNDSSVLETDNSVDVIVFQHGLHGVPADLRIIRSHLKAYFMYAGRTAYIDQSDDNMSCFVEPILFSSLETDHTAEFPVVRLVCCSPRVNQGVNSEDSLVLCASRFAVAVDEFIGSRIFDAGFTLRRICFVGFSLGGLIIRLALRHPSLHVYAKHFYSFVTIASPHLGVTHDTSAMFDTGVYLLRKWRKSQSLDQLALQDAPRKSNCLLYAMATGWNPQIKRSVSINIHDCMETIADSLKHWKTKLHTLKSPPPPETDMRLLKKYSACVKLCGEYLRLHHLPGHNRQWTDAMQFLARLHNKHNDERSIENMEETFSDSEDSSQSSSSPTSQRENYPSRNSLSSAQQPDIVHLTLNDGMRDFPQKISSYRQAQQYPTPRLSSPALLNSPTRTQRSWSATSDARDIRSQSTRSLSENSKISSSFSSDFATLSPLVVAQQNGASIVTPSSNKPQRLDESSGSLSGMSKQSNLQKSPQHAATRTDVMNPYVLHSGGISLVLPESDSDLIKELNNNGFWNGAEGCILRHFKHVWLVGSPQDKYSPLYSCRAELPQSSVQNPQQLQWMARQLEGFWHGVDLSNVTRISASFELNQKFSVNSMIGRAAHLQYCENEEVARWLATVLGFQLYCADSP